MITWTISEGHRGRRWREVRTDRGDAVVSSLLLETDTAGRFLHAELSTPAGLLTLHPEGDGTLHGNVVTGDGVHHVTGLPWSDEAMLVVEGSSLALAAVVHALGRRVSAGRRLDVAVAHVSLGLSVNLGTITVERLAEDSWRVAGGSVGVDADGLPAFPAGDSWPLELEWQA